MKWSTYKQLCARPDYWSRWMLEQCIDLLGQLEEASLQLALEHALKGEILATPRDHRGAEATRMYRLKLPREQRWALLRAMRQASDQGLRTVHTQQRGLGGFLAAWQEYAASEGP